MVGDRGKATLVTGGGRGLGRAIAQRLAGEGLAVGVLARTPEQVEAAAAAIRETGGAARGFVADVLDPVGLARAVRQFHDWAGRLDLLVGAAGQLRAVGPMSQVDPDVWWRDLETSVRGAQQTLRATLPLLRQSSEATLALLVGPGHNAALAFASGYTAAQAALVRLVESLAVELSQDGIRTYAIWPGLVPTDLMRRLLDRPEGRRWLPRFTEAFAEGKEVGPEVAAEMIAWLARHRPGELNGRVVAAPLSPEVLEARLNRIQDEDRNVLRLR